ncbi:MAG: prohibitin family protein [Clostridia bacterium]|nr:prohibitin family protein [Clostridia bacterium]
MMIGVLCGIVVIAIGIAFIAWAYMAFTRRYNKASRALSVLGILVSLALFAVVPFSFHTVDTGEIAVVKHLGEAREIRTAGTHFDLWVTEKYQVYDAKVQNLDITTAAYSSDAQTMTIQMTMQFQIMGDRVMDVAKQYGSLEVLQSRIQAIAIEKAKATLSSYKAMDIISDRAAMSPAVEDAIREAIGDGYYVNVVAVVLTNIDFSDAFEQAVEEKMIAEQLQLKAEYENQTKVAQAEAEAKAKLIAAEAEAKANELLEQSLTDKILREMYINKWDGKLPSVVTDGSVITDLTGAPAVE